MEDKEANTTNIGTTASLYDSDLLWSLGGSAWVIVDAMMV